LINENNILFTQKIEAFPLPSTTTQGVSTKSEPDPFIIGKKYHAIIESRLTNGWASVLVAGQSLQMAISASISHKKNTEIELTLISKEPILKFLLLEPLIHLGHKQNSTSISQAGQLLSGLLKATTNPQITPPHQIASTTPIIQSFPNSIVELANGLQQALTVSGLFYESHLAQWLTGKRSSDQLHLEPQSKLFDADKNQGSCHFVQQQLMALETGAIAWRGEIWSGQPVEWVVTEQENQDQGKEEDASSNWTSHIKITLPCLGQIVITLCINKLGTNIHIETAEDITNNLLINNQSRLIAAIEAEGIRVQSITVNKDESTDDQ
jgi:hypothetical protein